MELILCENYLSKHAMETHNDTFDFRSGRHIRPIASLCQNKSVLDVFSRITNHSVKNQGIYDLIYDNNDTFTDIQMIPEAPTYIVITATLFYVMIFLVGIFGNFLVIMVVCLSPTMKTSVNMWVINLCVADILVLLVCMPTALAEIYTKEAWYFGPFMCK